MNKDFTGEVSTYNKKEFNILAPGEQFWDGLTPEEKAGKVLVVPKHKKDKNGKIDYQNYEKLVIEKKDKNGKGISGVQFCISKYLRGKGRVCDETYDYSKWITGKDGKLEISTNELPLYNQTLIEIGETAKHYKLQNIDLYVDPGNRFLGEVKGTDFITYDELIATINGEIEPEKKKYSKGTSTKIGEVLSKGTDSATGGNWLKIYDARDGKTIYLSKNQLTNSVRWNQLLKAGLVFGLDQIDTSKEALEEFKTTKKLKMSKNYTGYSNYRPTTVEINGKSYIIRLLRGHSTKKNEGDPNKPSGGHIGKNITNGSEWNRFILPLINNKERCGRWTTCSENYIEKALQSYKNQLATYSWQKDLILMSHGGMSWTQELVDDSDNTRALRGFYETNDLASGAYRYSSSGYRGDFGFQPVLEEISDN